MNGPFCTSCGASVEGVRFCTSCGTPVTAPDVDPYEYLFAEPPADGTDRPAAGPTATSPAGPPDAPTVAPPGGPIGAPPGPLPGAPTAAPSGGPFPGSPNGPGPSPAPYQQQPYQQAPQPAPYQQQPYQQAPYQPPQAGNPNAGPPPAPPVWAGQAPAPAGYPGYAERRRRSFGWPWVVAAAVVLVAVIGAGLALTVGGHHAHTASSSPVTPHHALGATSSGGAPGTTGTPSSPPLHGPIGGVHAPARVASRVRALLVTEVADHRADNAAVGAMLSCTHVPVNRHTVASFARERRQLLQQLIAVPVSTSPQLNGVVRRLRATWRSLLPVDREYATWSRQIHGTHHKCHAPAAPATSQASKDQRHRLRNQWVAVLRAHPQWRVPQVPALIDSPGQGLAYLLL